TVTPCPASDNVDAAARTEEGRWWAVCSGGALLRGDTAATFEQLATLERSTGRIVTLEVDRAGDRLLAGTLRGRVLALDAHTGEVLHSTDTALGAIRQLIAPPAQELAL